MTRTRRNWEERFRNGSYPTDPQPSRVLESVVEAVPSGRALDVATGTGRNAVFLAEAGFRVDAIDQSRAGLRQARDRARDRGVDDRIEWIQADAESFPYPSATYDVVTISFYRVSDRFTAIKRALAPGGILFVQHRLLSTNQDRDGTTERFRYASNELLHACLDLTVLYYDERTEPREDDTPRSVVRIVARNSIGDAQSYPRFDGDA